MPADSLPYHTASAQYADHAFADAVTTLAPLLTGSAPDVEALNLAAICCFRLDRLDEAEAHWRRAIALDHTYSGGYGNLGNLLMARGDLSGAESVYRQAIDQLPDFALAHYNLGNLLAKRGDAPKRRLRCAAPSRFSPNWPKRITISGICCGMMGLSPMPKPRSDARSTPALLMPMRIAISSICCAAKGIPATPALR